MILKALIEMAIFAAIMIATWAGLKTFFLKLKFIEIRKIILAPREFYARRDSNDYPDTTIEYLYFRDKDITERTIGEAINVHNARMNVKGVVS